MTAKQKKLFLLTSMMSVFVMAVTILFASGNIKLKSIFTRASLQEYSVSFTRADSYKEESGAVYTYKKSTQAGNDIYLVSSGGLSRNSGAIASIPSATSTIDDPVIKFYKDSDHQYLFRQQEVRSLSVVTSRTLNLTISFSSDGVTYREIETKECSTEGTTFSSFPEYAVFISLTSSSRAGFSTNITSISLSYGCENRSYPVFENTLFETTVKDKSNLDSNMKIIFNDDHYGYYKFYYNAGSAYKTTLFTWQYDEYKTAIKVSYTSTAAGSISGETASGGTTEYQGYRLFTYNGSGYYNYVSVFDGKVSIYFHTTQQSCTDKSEYYKYNQRTDAVILSIN